MTAFLLAAWLAASQASHARYSRVDWRGDNHDYRIHFASPQPSRDNFGSYRDGNVHGRRVGADNGTVLGMVEKPVKVTARICARCGNEYNGALHSRYCGRSCESKAYRERKKHKGGGAKNPDMRTCARCGEQYDGALHGRYCGSGCKSKAYRERKARRLLSAQSAE